MKPVLISLSVIIFLGTFYIATSVLSTPPDTRMVEELEVSSETTPSSTPEHTQENYSAPSPPEQLSIRDGDVSIQGYKISACRDLDTLVDKYTEVSVPVKKAFGITDAREGVDDTDGDCLLDAFEIERCFPYCDPTLHITTSGVSEFETDYDNDGLTTGAEQTHGTNPVNNDTDGDGLDDGAEIESTTDPLGADSDADGIKDGTEIIFRLNPKAPDANTIGIYPASWVLAKDLEVTFYISGTALEVTKLQNSYGNYWAPHNHVFWQKYSLEAIDYSRYFDIPVMVEKVVIKNPAGQVFQPIYFLDIDSGQIRDFSDIAMARSSSVDTVTDRGNVHYIGSLIRAFALTDNLTQFTIEEEGVLDDLSKP